MFLLLSPVPPLHRGLCACWPRVPVASPGVGTAVDGAVPSWGGAVPSWGGAVPHWRFRVRGQVGLGSHSTSPAHLATAGGPQCCPTGRARCHPGGLGFVQVQGLLLGTSPCPLFLQRPCRVTVTSCGVTSASAMAASSSSSSLLPHLPPGWWLNGHSKGDDGSHGSGSAFSRMISPALLLEGGLQ